MTVGPPTTHGQLLAARLLPMKMVQDVIGWHPGTLFQTIAHQIHEMRHSLAHSVGIQQSPDHLQQNKKEGGRDTGGDRGELKNTQWDFCSTS